MPRHVPMVTECEAEGMREAWDAEHHRALTEGALLHVADRRADRAAQDWLERHNARAEAMAEGDR